MNTNSKPGQERPELINLFRDVRFRRAVSHAIDREKIAKVVFHGLAQPLYGPVSPANRTFYNPNVSKYKYDLKKAKALLATMGLTDTNGNGILETKGKDIRFEIVTNVENGQRTAMATMIAGNLRRIGLNVTSAPVTFNRVVGVLDSRPYDWEAVVLAFTGGPEPNDGRNIWRSTGNLHSWNPNQQKPATPWEAEIDDIYSRAAQELNLAKRKALYNRWQVIAAEQLPLIYTVVPDSVVAVHKRFGNLKPCPLGGVLWNIEELYDLSATRNRP